MGVTLSPKGTFHNVWRYFLLSQLVLATGIKWVPEVPLDIL